MVQRLPQRIISGINARGNLGWPAVYPLTLAGDGTGSPNIKGNHSPGSPGIYYLQPPSGKAFVIEKIQLLINVANPVVLAQYGSISTLANGSSFALRQDGVYYPFGIEGLAIKSNGNWLSLATSPVQILPFSEHYLLRFLLEFGDTLNSQGVLNGATDDRIVFRVEDDLSGLIKQSLTCFGYALDL